MNSKVREREIAEVLIEELLDCFVFYFVIMILLTCTFMYVKYLSD